MEAFTYEDYIYYKRILHQKERTHIGLRDVEGEYQYEYKTKKVANPHDKIFKEVLNNKEEVVKFLNEMLNLKNTEYALKEKDIEKYNREFITENFSKIESDVVYKKTNQNIFFLIEQQSTIDYSMPYRILKYNIAIMESAIDIFSLRQKNYKLPTVFSFVIYTGSKKWNVTNYLANKQERLMGCEGKDFANFQIVDVNDYTQKELLESESLLTKMMLLEKAKNYEELEKYLQTIVKRKMNSKQKEFIQRLIKYILKDKLSEEKFKEIIDQLQYKEEKGGDSMFVEIINQKIDEMLEIETRVKEAQTKMQEEQTKMQEEQTKMQEEQTKMQEEQTKMQEEQTKMQEEQTKMQEEKTKVKRERTKIKKREQALEMAENRIIIKMLKTNMDEKTIQSIIPINKKRLDKLKKELAET